MVPELRREFNARFTPEGYSRFLSLLSERCGMPVPFRNSETPCFFERATLERMDQCGRELIRQLMSDPAYLAAASEAVPAAFRVPQESPRPLFIQADFGLDADRNPMLVEIQGFPSLYAYQPVLAETYRDAYGLDPALRLLMGDWTLENYRQRLREVLLGGHDPENVILLEVHPYEQKTLPDFLLTEKLCAIAPVCITEVEKQGNRLYYRREGRRIPIHRIYNRIVPDELARKNLQTPFDLRDEIAVEWAGHPNWYFKISKFSLPFLKHPCVPETYFLDQVSALPEDLENWVLKPLFSFAGLGVRVGPTVEEVQAVSDRSQYILQRRVHFAPFVETPHGPTKVEVRIMYVWADDMAEPQALSALLRMGRGTQMGVDFNRNLEWVGASAAFTP
ncbi:MAG: hypothetical protein OHK0029_39440 [Armatimonadaceae bacterium]